MSDLALSLVSQLHRPRVYSCETAPSGYRICGECRQGWPCETSRVIESALSIQAPEPVPPPESPVGPTPRAPQPPKRKK